PILAGCRLAVGSRDLITASTALARGIEHGCDLLAATPWFPHEGDEWRFQRIRLRNSLRVAALLRNWPSITEVTIEEFCFSTPRIIMHMCWASMTTATPAAPVTFSMASAICRVRFSWICRRRAYMSTMRATLDRPSTLPLGM